MMGRKTSALLTVAATLAAAYIACKGGEAGRQQGAPAATGGIAAGPRVSSIGVTDTEILWGVPSAFDGPSAGLGVEMWRGGQAAIQEQNDAGGIHGRKIRLVLGSDGYDAERAAATAVKLIEQEHVFATGLGVGTPTIVRRLPVILQYYNSEKFFEFSNFTGAQPQRNPPYFPAVFNVRASYYQETKAIVDAFVAAGRNKIGAFVQNDNYGTDGRTGAALALDAHGLKLLADARYPRGQLYAVSNAPQVKLLRDAGVNAVVMVGSYQACGAFVRDARTSGWDVPIHNVSFVGPDQMLDLLKRSERETKARIIRNLVNTQVVPYYGDTSVAAVRDYQAAMDRYNPGVPQGLGDVGGYQPVSRYSFGSLEGYLSARAFLAVLLRVGRDLTRESFLRTAESMGRFELGVGAPAEFSATRHQALDKVWFTYATQEGWRPTEDVGSVLH